MTPAKLDGLAHLERLVHAYVNGGHVVITTDSGKWELQASFAAEAALRAALYATPEAERAALAARRAVAAFRRMDLRQPPPAGASDDADPMPPQAAAAPDAANAEDEINNTAWDLLLAEVQQLEQDPPANFRMLACQSRWAIAVVKALLARHHPAASEDDVDDVLDALGPPANALSAGITLYQLWMTRDQLGVYVDGGDDPTVTVGPEGVGQTLTLRFRARAMRHIAAVLEEREPAFTDYREVTRAALLRFHAALAQEPAIVDDVAWQLGIGGLGRLLGGPALPVRAPQTDTPCTRLHDDPESAAADPATGGGAADPNAPAPGDHPGESTGTSCSS